MIEVCFPLLQGLEVVHQTAIEAIGRSYDDADNN